MYVYRGFKEASTVKYPYHFEKSLMLFIPPIFSTTLPFTICPLLYNSMLIFAFYLPSFENLTLYSLSNFLTSLGIPDKTDIYKDSKFNIHKLD